MTPYIWPNKRKKNNVHKKTSKINQKKRFNEGLSSKDRQKCPNLKVVIRCGYSFK
jgi:hypothetical protein